MKKKILLLLVGVLILSLGLVSAADSCVDTDGSATAFLLKGTVTGTNSSGTFSYTDSCVTTKYLKEYGCSGTSGSVSTVNCSKALSYSGSVCSGGACSASTASKSAPGLDSVGSSGSSLYWILGLVGLLLVAGAYWFFSRKK